MKLKNRIAITRRGYQMLGKYCPGLIRGKVIIAVLEALAPLVTVWFSARIINEIEGNRDTGTLILLVLLAVGINFAFSMIRNAMNRVVSEKESKMWNFFSKIFSDKQMNMPYADLEDQEIQKQRQKVQENLFMFGNGLGQLVWDTPSLVKVIVDCRHCGFRRADRIPLYRRNREYPAGFPALDYRRRGAHDPVRSDQFTPPEEGG